MGLKIFLVITLSTFVLNTAYALDATQQMEMLTAHNKYRTTVGIPALTWSATLAKTAQAYADKLKTTQACKSLHSHAEGLGENLYWASAMTYSNGTSKQQTITSTQVTDAWGSEKDNYTYGSNTCATGKVCGHYTQVIWKTTTQVGCGIAMCNDNTQVWVCNYTPAGNFVGKKPY
jgi:pathogenesis-related protein 1